MIISVNTTIERAIKKGIGILVEGLNAILESWNISGLSPVQSDEMETFARDPVGFFHERIKQVIDGTDLKGTEPEEYARLNKIRFTIDSTYLPFNVELLHYVYMEGGIIYPVDNLDQLLSTLGAVETENEKQEAVAEFLFKAYKDFMYAASIINGRGMLVTPNCSSIGFYGINPGNLTLQTIRKAVEGMERLPREEFEKQLESRFANPAFCKV